MPFRCALSYASQQLLSRGPQALMHKSTVSCKSKELPLVGPAVTSNFKSSARDYYKNNSRRRLFDANLIAVGISRDISLSQVHHHIVLHDLTGGPERRQIHPSIFVPFICEPSRYNSCFILIKILHTL